MLRLGTQAIFVHIRQVVSAVSGLTMAINALARGIEDGVMHQWTLVLVYICHSNVLNKGTKTVSDLISHIAHAKRIYLPLLLPVLWPFW